MSKGKFKDDGRLAPTYSEPTLLPGSASDRAYIRSVALQVACEIHPVNNLRVLKQLKKSFGISDEQKTAWYRHWIDVGFSSLEKRLASDTRVGDFVFGSAPTLADVCLVPQVWNARRFNIPLEGYSSIARIANNAFALKAFQKAEPANQPDAE